jgi:hypothetical protein
VVRNAGASQEVEKGVPLLLHAVYRLSTCSHDPAVAGLFFCSAVPASSCSVFFFEKTTAMSFFVFVLPCLVAC